MERAMLKSRYWVVGGEYTSCDCETIVQGTERVIGPFESRTEAERTWRTLSEEITGRRPRCASPSPRSLR
jgi:hypothetical protein